MSVSTEWVCQVVGGRSVVLGDSGVRLARWRLLGCCRVDCTVSHSVSASTPLPSPPLRFTPPHSDLRRRPATTAA